MNDPDAASYVFANWPGEIVSVGANVGGDVITGPSPNSNPNQDPVKDAYNLFFGAVVPVIDNTAHIGGLVSGLALGAVLAPRLTSPPDERNSWRRFVFIVAGAVLALAFELARHLVLRQFIQQPTP